MAFHVQQQKVNFTIAHFERDTNFDILNLNIPDEKNVKYEHFIDEKIVDVLELLTKNLVKYEICFLHP